MEDIFLVQIISSLPLKFVVQYQYFLIFTVYCRVSLYSLRSDCSALAFDTKGYSKLTILSEDIWLGRVSHTMDNLVLGPGGIIWLSRLYRKQTSVFSGSRTSLDTVS
ncbi:hypothetical protein H5410_017529 [Solanum commersonii]|uniref:Uncharacterized protein n=1 Tax=Solanum commersonii TaxID=4109 RepID=A0A9J5ZZJ4_SOLCO|nr:hypothetical protein H5410_017529 [Solanum commersonii]